MPLKILGNIDPELANRCINEAGRLFNRAGFDPRTCFKENKNFTMGNVYNPEDCDFWQFAQATVEQIVEESNQQADCVLTWED